MHMLLWLQDAPDCAAMHHLLGMEDFQEQIHCFIHENICVHIDGLDESTIKMMP